jgi:hypothetical protein
MRIAGQVLRGLFIRHHESRSPVIQAQTARCGECGGNLWLEPDDPITPALAAQFIAHRFDPALRHILPRV